MDKDQNKSFSQTILVTEAQTASQFGSGLLPVFATPALIALMENTAMQLITLPAGGSSVGISINMQHLKASPVGAEIQCTATITAVEGRKYTFEIIATDSSSDLVGKATHERVVVDIEKFMSKIVSV
ncbi:MAG: thioesterase family protein [Paludibacter sp.]|nr:thioesterase family protein [Paludibacter sp.]